MADMREAHSEIVGLALGLCKRHVGVRNVLKEWLLR
jgi:hypothetical protein